MATLRQTSVVIIRVFDVIGAPLVAYADTDLHVAPDTLRIEFRDGQWTARVVGALLRDGKPAFPDARGSRVFDGDTIPEWVRLAMAEDGA